MKHQLKTEAEKCLSEYPESRNSDILLLTIIWQRYYGVGESVDLKQLYYLPTHESVKRYRARFNQFGLYMATDPTVLRARNQLQEVVREDLGYESKQSITTRAYEAQKLF